MRGGVALHRPRAGQPIHSTGESPSPGSTWRETCYTTRHPRRARKRRSKTGSQASTRAARSSSGGTILTLPAMSASGMVSTRSPRRAVITPVSPAVTASIAATPNRLPRIRSVAVGDPRVHRDPAGVPPHHLDHHHAVVALSGGVQPVDGLCRDVERGVEPDRQIGSLDVVVDRLGDRDHPHPGLGDLAGRMQGPVATDADQGLEPLGLERRQDCLDAALVRMRVVPRGTQQGPTEGQHVTDLLTVDGEHVTVDDALPAVPEADDRVTVRADAVLDDGSDRRVEPWAVAAPGEQSDAHGQLFDTL